MHTQLPFSCPRTCPLVSAAWCRFRPVLDRIGRTQVNSYTAKIKVDYRDERALRAAVESLGWKWIGAGSHRLWEGRETGLGWTVPGLPYPFVVRDGVLYCDDHEDYASAAARLKAEYSLALAEQSAYSLGWTCERTAEGLTIFHPEGGTLSITSAGAEAHGFSGSGCHDALLALNLPLSDSQPKQEYSQITAGIQIPAS